MNAAQHPSLAVGAQAPAPGVTQAPAPQPAVTQQIQPTQLQIGELLNSIMPLIVIVMMMGILMPMMRQMSGAFGSQ